MQVFKTSGQRNNEVKEQRRAKGRVLKHLLSECGRDSQALLEVHGPVGPCILSSCAWLTLLSMVPFSSVQVVVANDTVSSFIQLSSVSPCIGATYGHLLFV